MDLLTLVAKLTLDTDDYEKGLEKAKKSVDEAGKGIKKGMLKATGIGAAALTAFAGASVKTGAEFDASMSQVAATLGKTMSELETEVGAVDTAYGNFSGNLREYAMFMGSQTAFSAKQAADALNYMALAGYDTQKSMEMLPTVLSLAAAGGMELARASDMVTDASSALNLTQDDTVKLVDQMAKTASKTNTSVEQLGDAILTVGGTASYMKGGTTELNQVLGILADNSMKGSEGGTHLRNILLKLASPTKEGATWIEKLGLSIFDAEGNMRSFSEIFPELNKAMEKLTDEQKLDALSQMFNARDIAAVNSLLNTSTDRWNELSTSIDDATGSAQQMAETQLDNLEGDVTLLKSAFEGLQINLADKLTPAIRGVVQFMTTAITTIDQWAPIVIGLATAFGTLAIALNFKAIIGGLTTNFTALWTVLSANPIGVVIAIVAGLAAGIISLWNTNEGFRNAVTNAWESIKAKADELGKKFNEIKDKIAKAMETARDKVHDAIEKIKSFFNFKWGLPKLKMPHFSFTGKFSLNPPSVPKFDIQWYKKAYNNIVKFPQNTVLPTADGYKGFSDGVGSEVLMSEAKFLESMRSAQDYGTSLTSAEIVDEIRSLKNAVLNMQIVLDSGTLVGELTPAFDTSLGNRAVYSGRGN